MDRKYIEENLSAYLDGELQPKEMREFERDIQAYPDLFAELQTLQRLNKLALDSKVHLPNDAYFDDLAGKIDLQIKRESPRERSRIVEFLLVRRKAVAIITSAAAVLLIALIGMNMFGPNAKRYPNELRTIEIKPAILQSPKTDTATIWPQHEQKIVPPPQVVDDSVKQEVRAGSVAKSKPADLQSRQQDEPMAPVQKSQTQTESASVTPDTLAAKERIAAAEKPTVTGADQVDQLTSPAIKQQPGGVSSSARTYGLSSNSALPSVFLQQVDSITIRTETILPEPFEEKNFADAAPGKEVIKPDIERFHAGSGKSWATYVRVFSELNQNMYSGWSLKAPAASRDSLQSWIDSLKILGPSQWYAEQAFRALQADPPNWDEYQRCRAYIDYYLAEHQVPDSSVWNRRIDLVNEVLERQLGKINQNRK